MSQMSGYDSDMIWYDSPTLRHIISFSET